MFERDHRGDTNSPAMTFSAIRSASCSNESSGWPMRTSQKEPLDVALVSVAVAFCIVLRIMVRPAEKLPCAETTLCRSLQSLRHTFGILDPCVGTSCAAARSRAILIRAFLVSRAANASNVKHFTQNRPRLIGYADFEEART